MVELVTPTVRFKRGQVVDDFLPASTSHRHFFPSAEWAVVCFLVLVSTAASFRWEYCSLGHFALPKYDQRVCPCVRRHDRTRKISRSHLSASRSGLGKIVCIECKLFLQINPEHICCRGTSHFYCDISLNESALCGVSRGETCGNYEEPLITPVIRFIIPGDIPSNNRTKPLNE